MGGLAKIETERILFCLPVTVEFIFSIAYLALCSPLCAKAMRDARNSTRESKSTGWLAHGREQGFPAEQRMAEKAVSRAA